MENFTLVIGNKNYSSWSLRAWLLMKQAGVPFREIRIVLYTPESKARIQRYSPSGKVPVLLEGESRIGESLAICEYIADRYPDKRLWPQDLKTRALARSVSTEMHAGFSDLRTHLPMNCRKRLPARIHSSDVVRDIERVTQIWNDCRSRYGKDGPFLFGHFTVADAMFAPVALRFVTYDITVDKVSAAYVDTIRNMNPVQQWIADARAEIELIDKFEMDA